MTRCRRMATRSELPDIRVEGRQEDSDLGLGFHDRGHQFCLLVWVDLSLLLQRLLHSSSVLRVAVTLMLSYHSELPQP